MQKILAYLVLLLLPIAARGQALSDWYYWFDTDKVPQKSGQVSDQKFRLEADVSNLSIGAHTLFVQVADTAGVYSPPIGTWFYHVPDTKNMDKLYYWVGDENIMHSVDFGDGKFELDVSGIPTGIHSLNLQVMDKKGSVSAVNTYLFYKVPASAKVEKLRYWIDAAQETKEIAYGQNNFLLDVSEYSPGFHFIYYYVVDGDGKYSAVQSAGFYRMPIEASQKLYYWFAGDTQATEVKDFRNGFVADVTRVQEGFNTMYIQFVDHGPTDIETHHFIKVAQTEGSGDLTVACIIDGEIAAEQKVPCYGGVIKLDMDVSNIEVGLHKAMFQVITPTGAGSSIAETYFIRTLSDADVATMQCSYTIDGFKHYTQKGTLTNGTFHFDLPVDEVEDGLHRIDFMLVAENGATTTSGNAWFFKTPVGGNGITQYDYWLNDKADEVTKVTLNEYQDPFQLIKLLPVPSEPIRSSCFQFEVKDENPMMYAKNDIHFRFHDRTGRWVDESKQYVDYNTSAAITDVAQLKPTQTFARPEENDIKWFKFEAAPGDTIGFKSSQATTLQVFSPSGKEILSTMGDKSVQYIGAHTWEDGTYYVAVHDVTGSKPSVTLDYMHMDKYDVVSQDVHVVGNGGCSTITFQGNGFGDLYAVDLKDSKGNVIQSIDVGHESDATTTVTFDFTDTKLGKYNAVFHFTEDDKTVTNCITVEEAKEIELATKVSFPSTFLRGTSVTYTVEITNNGNMTAYFVPTEIKLITQDFNSISSILFKDNNGYIIDGIHLEEIDTDSIESDLITEYTTEINKITGLSSFTILRDSINSCDVGFTDRYYTIQSNSTFKFLVEIMCPNEVSLFVRVPNNWFSVNLINESKARLAKSDNGICCEKEKWECISGNISNALGFLPGAAGCIASLTDLGVFSTFEIMCANGNSPLERMKNALSTKSSDFISKGFGSVLSCAGAGILRKIQNLKKKYKELEQTRKLKLQQAVNNNRIYENAMSNYEKKMRLAEKYYNEGNIAEAERIKVEAKTIKKDAQRFKEESDKCYEEADHLTGEMNNCNKQIDQENLDLATILDRIKTGLNQIKEAISCSNERLDAAKKCNGGDDKGGTSNPVNSYDPNDIYGYIAPSGSMYVGDEILTLPYRIEFENDTTFATSSAHKVVVKDTLDAKVFDLASYQPTSIKIGDKSVQLKGDKTFVTTVDMRPGINAIAQVEGLYDEKKGIVTWQFTSLDPMTMEPTDDVMQGFLPVNYDGSGIGEVAYNINRKAGLSDGTAISNKASIVFDNNDAIETPTWTNIIDAIPPVTHVSDVKQVNDTIVRVHFDGDDNRSGVWKYALYVQYGEVSSWFQVAETDTTCFDFRFYEDIDYGFCVVATDMAGNVEKKVIRREYKFINGEGEMTDGISSIKADQVATNEAYDLSGRLIQEEGYRGILIKNRKKIFKR